MCTPRTASAASLVLLAVSCGGDGGRSPSEDVTDDLAADAAGDSSDGASDGSGEGDTERDALADGSGVDADPGDAVLDAGPDLTRDAIPEEGPEVADVIDEPEPCAPGPTTEPPPGGRWALSMFHFNVQYVAGGTDGLAEITFEAPWMASQLNLSEQEVEDRIITESYEPLLGILERNPAVAITTEMQGYMIDIIRERHPEVLARMRALVDAGQLEIASIHWSDQFFLSFGREDMDESWRRNVASFEAADIPLSPIVFTQEGQFGEGFAAWLEATRPDAVMVMARNLFGFYQSTATDHAYWNEGGLDVLLPRGLFDATVERIWHFFDDGELLATGEMNPYVGRTFAENAGAVRTYERELQCLVEQGWQVGRVSDYMEAVRATGFEPPDLPPFIDGTWQPGSTRGPLRWTGGAGGWPRHERDNQVLTTCVRARHSLLALSSVTTALGDSAPPAMRDTLGAGWRELLLGQVSDARGVNPWWGEIQYGLAHCGAAGDSARESLEAERLRRGAVALLVDTDSNEVIELGGTPRDNLVEVPAPIEVTVSEDRDAPPTLTWFRAEGALPESPDPWLLVVLWPPRDGAQQRYDDCLAADDEREGWYCDAEPRPVALRFPREAGLMEYRPALALEPVRYTEADFSFSEDALSEFAWTPSADGFVGLGDSIGYVIKDVATTHVGLGWPVGDGVNTQVEFRDETLQPRFEQEWRFWFTPDRDGALDLANRNLRPTVIVAAED